MRFFKRRMSEPRHVTLYGKPGCHLCDDARELLAVIGRDVPLVVDEIDIRSDPALFRRYDIRIPVLTIDGGPEVEAPITPDKLRRVLAARDDPNGS